MCLTRKYTTPVYWQNSLRPDASAYRRIYCIPFAVISSNVLIEINKITPSMITNYTFCIIVNLI